MSGQTHNGGTMRAWLPWASKIVGTAYLLEVPAILLLRTIVLMFVPSKIDWLETFHGIQMRTWAVVLAVAAITHLASGVTGWVIGVWLARQRPRAMQRWRMFTGWLLLQHLAWSIWIVSWHGSPPVERNHHEQNTGTVTG